MKSFSNLLEKAETPSVKDNLAPDRANRKYEKKFGKSLSVKDVERLKQDSADSARLADIERDSRGKSGERARKDVVKTQGLDDLNNKINKDRTRPITKADKGKFFGKPTGVDVATGKAKYVPPKEIPGKINQKYGGRRARTRPSNQPSFAQVKAGIDRKDTLEKTNKLKRQNTSTTKVVKQSVISKKSKKFTDTVNQSNKNRTSTGTKSSTLKIDSKYTLPKTSTPSLFVDTSKPTSGIKIDSKPYTPPKTSTPLIKVDTPPKSKFTSNTTGKLSDTAWKADTKKSIKPAKTFKQFASKFPKPVRSFARGGSKLLGKAVGPAFAAIDGIGNYKSYKKQGYNTSGAIARSGAKTGAYWGGWAAGAKGGAALGATIGSAVPIVGTAAGALVGGIAGGLAGGHLAGKTADWAVKGYDHVFGRQKLKDIKAKNIAKMNAKSLKADPWKAYKTQPKVSNTRIATNKGNLRTINLKKGKDGSYIMPRGFTAGGTVNRTTQLATKTA